MKHPYCFTGLIQTITAVEMLWDDLQTQQEYFIISHINNDPLENMISMLRQFKGSYEYNPSIYRIQRNLKQIMFQNSTPSPFSGYVDSESKNLINFEPVRQKDQSSSHADIDIDDDLEEDISIEEYSEILEDVFTSCSPQDKLKYNSMLYFFGYLAHKVANRKKCDYCKDHVTNPSPELSNKYLLIQQKSFKSSSSQPYGSLTVPTLVFEAELSKIYTDFQELFPNIRWKKNLINEHLFSKINGKIPQAWL